MHTLLFLRLAAVTLGILQDSTTATATKTSKNNRFNKLNNNLARASRILYISLPSLHDYDVKMPNFMFVEDVNKQLRNFLSLSELRSVS